ncbi:MAG: hypothetical protein GTO14_03555, partial [Anaerolineales bacterium]|nr:hypothetical protein [Anaerolineales bacterium]
MDVQSALQNLTDSLKDALEGAKAEGAQAFEAGEFESAQQAACQGKAIEAILDEVKQIGKRWDAIKAPQEISQAPKTLSLGSEATEEDYIIPILYVLEDLGGKGSTEEILDKVETLVKDDLKPVDYELLNDGESIRWQNSARSAHEIMAKRGLLYSESAKGVWQITP